MVQLRGIIDQTTLEGFVWDKGNMQKNFIAHQVEDCEAEEVFVNHPQFMAYDAAHSQDEERFTVLGVTNERRLLTVIFTLRGSKIRVISARDQSRKERKYYEQQAKKSKQKNTSVKK